MCGDYDVIFVCNVCTRRVQTLRILLMCPKKNDIRLDLVLFANNEESTYYVNESVVTAVRWSIQ